MKCFYANVDRLTQTKKAELESIIVEESPDIIGLTEIFPKRSVFSPDEEINKINGYDVFMDPKAKGRGVVLYVKKVLSANIYDIETSFQEVIFCKIKLRNSDSMLIGCFYRSPNSTIENFTSLTELLR